MDEPDEALMARIQTGDAVAFNRLVERHLRPVHAYAFRLTRSRNDADDLAQETFLKVWQRAETWRAGEVRVTTWLHRIAHNAFVDAWRRREPTLPMDDDFEVVLDGQEPLGDTDPSVALRRALEQLPLHQRTAVALALVNGFTTAETAHIMGLSTHAVESLIARARRALRQSDNKGANREISAA